MGLDFFQFCSHQYPRESNHGFSLGQEKIPVPSANSCMMGPVMTKKSTQAITGDIKTMPARSQC